MKYKIILALEVEAEPVDFAEAAKKGFNAIAHRFNSGRPIEIHLLPLDDSAEAVMGEKVLASCFKASSKPTMR